MTIDIYLLPSVIGRGAAAGAGRTYGAAPGQGCLRAAGGGHAQAGNPEPGERSASAARVSNRTKGAKGKYSVGLEGKSVDNGSRWRYRSDIALPPIALCR
eukprot:3801341-Pleurochrysis_carterae.AAC.1